jgi:hypothetical protein
VENARLPAAPGKYSLRASSERLVDEGAADATVRSGYQDSLAFNLHPVVVSPRHG